MKFAQTDDLMILYYQGDLEMKEIINFLKDIFLMQEDNSNRIGLSQFKIETPVEKKPVPKNIFATKEVKISDLMRRSV